MTPAEPLRVLLLENDEGDAALIMHAVRQADPAAHIDLSVTREEFTGFLAERDYDIVLSDYRLPDWTGMEALAELRRLGFDTPLIIITGELGDERAVECVKAGAADYVLKGPSMARLPIAVNRAIEEKRARDESLHAQRTLEESVERFRLLTDASFDAVAITHEGIIREANQGFMKMYGYGMDEIIGRPVTDFVEPSSRREVEARLVSQIEGTYEHLGTRKDGKKIVLEATSRSYATQGGRMRITALRDLTERRALEDQFRQAQKMEAVGRLAGGVAHDFNNMLTVITGYTDMLMAQFGADDQRLADLKEVRKAADGAAALTRQLLAFSRQQVIEPKVIMIEDVVRHSHKMLVRLIGEDIDLAMHFGPMPCVVYMDPGQLEQVITNLAVNSRDAMPTGGRLTIETSIVELDASYAAAHWPTTTGRYAMLALSDTGVGMDEVTRSRIFEPFFTTKDAGQGTGLGLATVYGIIKQSGGFIWAYSEPDHGATFKIYLPLHDDTPASLRETNAGQRAPRGTETILLVEDSKAVRDIAERTLGDHGYDVIAALSPTAALEIAATLGRSVHLLLTDVVMPEMSGRVLAERFATLQPNAKVLYMSGYTDDAIIRHGVLRAKTHFLQKPFTPMMLVTRVREILDN